MKDEKQIDPAKQLFQVWRSAVDQTNAATSGWEGMSEGYKHGWRQLALYINDSIREAKTNDQNPAT